MKSDGLGHNKMDLKQKYLSIIKSNQRKTKGFRYTVPSSKVYPHQWLWDSCFHAIIYSKLKKFDYAKDEIRSLLTNQWKNGMIPHMIYWKKNKKHNVNWGTKKRTSSITQPPMIAYAVEKIYKETKDNDFIREVFEKLDRYYKWLNRDRSDNFLLFVIHPWETGGDDFVEWDKIYGSEDQLSQEDLRKIQINILKEYIKTKLDSKKFSKKNIFNVKCVMFNSIYLRNLKSMLYLTKIINSKEKKYYNYLIQKIKKNFKKDLYNKKLDLYFSYYRNKGFFENIETSSLFLPLFAGIMTKKQAKKIVKNYLLNEDKFWTKYPVPTVSIDNQNFQPNRCWRGSIWININWFIHKGLIDYGLRKEAHELRKRTLDLIKKSGFHEYYNSINGKGLGPKDFIWSGLIFDMEG